MPADVARNLPIGYWRLRHNTGHMADTGSSRGVRIPLSDKRVVVSDHALVRWLQRVHGIDMDYFRAELAKIAQPAVTIGSAGFTRDGMTYVVEGTRLVTVRKR